MTTPYLKEIEPTDDWPLSKAKEWLRERLDEGDTCPLCARWAQRYKRKLNSGIALALKLIYRHYRGQAGGEYIHVPRYLSAVEGLTVEQKAGVAGGGDWAKLRYWGLIEGEEPVVAKPGEKKPRRSKKYRITQRGIDFVDGKIRVPKYVIVYDDKQYRCKDQTTVSMAEALGDRFDQEELMEGAAGGSDDEEY